MKVAVTLMFVTITLLTLGTVNEFYKVTYNCSPLPTLGIKESTSTIELYYPIIDNALASPTVVGTVVVYITKNPKIGSSPFAIKYVFDKEYFYFFEEVISLLGDLEAVFEGEVTNPMFALKHRRYTLGSWYKYRWEKV